ncbi:hypothetical protein FRC03_010307 [Tulasnella sp. 419]|nr:hypothetical protein FRC03_010307 [Tulasnella sp. 419]
MTTSLVLALPDTYIFQRQLRSYCEHTIVTVTRTVSSSVTRTFTWPSVTKPVIPRCPQPTNSITRIIDSIVASAASGSPELGSVGGLVSGAARGGTSTNSGFIPVFGTFSFVGSEPGSFILFDCTPKLYPASYKSLVWTPDPYTDYWIVSLTRPIATSSTSPFGARSTFLNCGTNQQIYLQTGTDVPPATMRCQNITLRMSGMVM